VKKIIKGILITLLAAGIIFLVPFGIIAFFVLDHEGIVASRRSVWRMEREFRQSRAALETVRDYLMAPGPDGGPGFGLNDVWRLETLASIQVQDEAAAHAMRVLFSRGYRQIIRRGYTIGFQRWGSGRTGSGVLYALHGLDSLCVARRRTLGEANFPRLRAMREEGWFFWAADMIPRSASHASDPESETWFW